MMRRTAMVGGAVAVAAGSALVVAPSATIRVRNASTPVTVTTTASLDALGARTVELGPVEAEAGVPATGVAPATAASGYVTVQYDTVQNLSFLGGFLDCFAFFSLPAYCDSRSPAPPRHLNLAAGTRLLACPISAAEPDACPHPTALITTARADLPFGAYSNPIPVRAVAPGPAGNIGADYLIQVTGGPDVTRYFPHSGLAVRLTGPLQGGGDAGRPAVAQADVDRAAAAARAQLSQMLTEQATQLLQPGEVLATPLQDANITLRPTVTPVGTVAATVTVAGTASGRAVAVRSDALQSAAVTAVEQGAAGRHILDGSVRWDAPAVQPGAVARLGLTAHAVATDLDGAALRRLAAWHGTGITAAAVHRLDPHATVSIDGGPAFLDRRVRLVVDGYAD